MTNVQYSWVENATQRSADQSESVNKAIASHDLQSRDVSQAGLRESTHVGEGSSTAVHKNARSRPTVHPAGVSPSFIETDFTELEDGTQIEMIEDPENSSRTLLAVFKDGEVRLTDRLRCEDRVFVPIPRSSNLIRHVRLPRGVERYESVRSILKQAASILSSCLDMDQSDMHLLALFAISTWFIERLPVAPYIALVGLPRSGKSTALTVLSLLCRRSLLTADITSAAFYRVCERITPTLLIDETNTAGERRALFHLLRTGTTRDVVALRKDQSFKTFGPKVISWIEIPNDTALNSRCVIVSLHETRRTDLLRPTSPEVRQAADNLQKQLLRFRFEKAKQLTLPKIEGDDRLHSRSRDLYQALVLPMGEDTEVCQWVTQCLENQDAAHRVPLSAAQAAVLRTLFKCVHKSEKDGRESIGDLSVAVNFDLRAAGESFRVHPREVGNVLKSLGFTKRKRTNIGWVVSIGPYEEKKIHDLIGAYAVEHCAELISEAARTRCKFCKDLGTPSGCLEKKS